ncbi:MAG TPA: hypothetical protein VFZ69_13000 [Longimicrobiales bacterium]
MPDGEPDRTRAQAVQEAGAAEGQSSATRRSIARRDFEQVIRRAAELSLGETDADENLSEEEVFRIATELGLPAQHVRQALFELPELRVRPRWYDGWFGPAVHSAGRVVPSAKDPVLRRVEDYLVTREYLQILRRRRDTIALVPADDTISSLARALARRGNRHTIARATRLMVGVHGIPGDSSHVRFDIDLSDTRRDLLRTGAIVGGSLGLASGAIAVMAVTAVVPEALGPLPEALAFAGAWTATAAAGIRVAASRFRERVFAAKLELTGLLDRLERGDRLDPPPAPWRRKLDRLFGAGR